MSEIIISINETISKTSFIDTDTYKAMYAKSVNDPEGFWGEQAKRLEWISSWKKVKNTSFIGDVHIRWFEGATLNVSANCIDRHLKDKTNQTAIIWQADDPAVSRHISYLELHEQVCRMANVLKSKGVQKGDRVTIYLPMIPEAAYAMLACARIGAIHSVVFGGFSAESLRGRIEDCDSSLLITADESVRGGKAFALKANADAALKGLGGVKHVLVVKRTGAAVYMQEGRDVWLEDEMQAASPSCDVTVMDANDPLFILYTSGSTGKPKGVLHGTAGYLLHAAFTHETVFDYKQGEVFWCTADVGWVTGHTYVVYGPLANGATTLMFEGVPTYPDFGRFWAEVDKHKVNIFHTAPTAIRALMREGDAWVKQYSRKSLRIIGSVGEPINPEAWMWYYNTVGDTRCPVVDTWWQTETGGILITPFPGATPLKPGSASWPFFGVQPVVLDQNGTVLEGECSGLLCIKDSWPGQMQTVYGDHARFKQTYFSQYAGYYFTGDGCRRDADGYYWITGRVDDVINVSGHRLGSAEIESALVAHPHVAEAAVVGFPHDIKGQGIYAYVTLNVGVDTNDALHKELIQWVRKEISAIASPDVIHFTPALPKTRSGKIMRRILRKIAEREFDSLGDISTLLNPEIVEELVQKRLTY